MKDSQLRARDVVRSSNMKISRPRLADNVKILHKKSCRTIIFFHSTNPQFVALSLMLLTSNLKPPSDVILLQILQARSVRDINGNKNPIIKIQNKKQTKRTKKRDIMTLLMDDLFLEIAG